MSSTKFDVERFNLRKVNDVEVKEQYQIKFSNRFAGLENVDDDVVDISRAWGSIRGNIKASAIHNLGCYELKQHKPWFNSECSKLLDQMKQAEQQWL
jgi:hypothetical protein